MEQNTESTPVELLNMDTIASGLFELSPIPGEADAYPNQASENPLPPSSNDAFGLMLSVGGVRPIWQLDSLFCYQGTWRDDRRSEEGGRPQEIIFTVATGQSSFHFVLTSESPQHLQSFVKNGICIDF
jgi:hypothetical protein